MLCVDFNTLLNMNYLAASIAAVCFVSLSGCGGGGGCASSTCVDTVSSGGAAVSVSIGSGDKIEATAKEIKYAFRYAVTVSDAQGRPVVGAAVSPSVEMIGFYKGRLFRAADLKVVDAGVVAAPGSAVKIGPIEFCPNEDKNNNFLRDPDEPDVNGDGVLTPEGASVVATIEGSSTTDNQGIVYFRVEYAKADAFWLAYKLTAVARVTGTEGMVTQIQQTGFAVGEESTASTPFVASRFGVTPGCNNAI